MIKYNHLCMTKNPCSTIERGVGIISDYPIRYRWRTDDRCEVLWRGVWERADMTQFLFLTIMEKQNG